MKKYFVDIVPLGIPIADGLNYERIDDPTQLVLTPDGVFNIACTVDGRLYCREHMAYNWTYTRWYKSSECSLLLTVLCTKEFGINDRVKFLGNDNKIHDWSVPLTASDYIRVKDDPNFFKVVGPISHKATFVKKGDEFDEHEVEKGDESRVAFFKVMGPDGLFH